MVSENEQSMFTSGLNIYAVMGSKLYFAAPNAVKLTAPAVRSGNLDGEYPMPG
jgi:hypothetical protein